MRMSVSQLRRVICEANVATDALADEIVTMLDDNYKDSDDEVNRPYSIDRTSNKEDVILDVYITSEAITDVEEFRGVIKSAIWMYAGEEPKVVSRHAQGPNGSGVVMKTRNCYVDVVDNDFSGGYVGISVRQRHDMSEGAMSTKIYRLMPEIKAEFVGYLGSMFGDVSVKVGYDGVKHSSIHVAVDDSFDTLEDVANELAGIAQLMMNEATKIEFWAGHKYIIEVGKSLMVTLEHSDNEIYIVIMPWEHDR